MAVTASPLCPQQEAWQDTEQPVTVEHKRWYKDGEQSPDCLCLRAPEQLIEQCRDRQCKEYEGCSAKGLRKLLAEDKPQPPHPEANMSPPIAALILLQTWWGNPPQLGTLTWTLAKNCRHLKNFSHCSFVSFSLFPPMGFLFVCLFVNLFLFGGGV